MLRSSLSLYIYIHSKVNPIISIIISDEAECSDADFRGAVTASALALVLTLALAPQLQTARIVAYEFYPKIPSMIEPWAELYTATAPVSSVSACALCAKIRTSHLHSYSHCPRKARPQQGLSRYGGGSSDRRHRPQGLYNISRSNDITSI